ncbi:preprotein translocase subunit SecE [Candidatus Berkelbacteria bacterium RIFCSPHIGHO2_12_FULL_36_9]|uniref:Protein translocase subunit SecE n=1 Tax=Candidatus Berkelbacteria bacterium RIFCSPHIGHO2_12_FULL_36_9 TaxID=1797469 RepID=A0A1F5EDV9_9BACT|nr:MAG: preprotein translocase subunit SecE [Candidatus Berkelbacteria bacterium RIFCSPHIGHO2_12_FULL_36_9]
MIKKIQAYFQGVITETKKVTWPNRQQIINHTVTVLVTVAIATIIFGSIDFGLSKILEMVILGR